MANPGSKFVSVNLNKSYGQQQQTSHHSPYQPFNGSYSQGPGGWGRGGGGGMVVLSKNRGSTQKAVSKLSVPPPLNLPSLRKEHERFDLTGNGRGSGSGAGSGSGSRPSSSGVGWTKTVAAATTALIEKSDNVVDGIDSKDVVSRSIGSYMPPSARSNGLVGAVGSSSRDFQSSVEKAMVLRGEDFPSLQAARPVSADTSQKRKDSFNQKQKQGEELNKRERYHSIPVVDMGQSSRNNTTGGETYSVRESTDQIRKVEEYFPSPLPLVRFNPRSEWADDERDTGNGFTERRRETAYQQSERYWDADFDFPRQSVLPQKPIRNQNERWSQRDNETGKSFPSEVLKIDSHHKDSRVPSRESGEVVKWRNSPLPKDRVNSQVGNDVGPRIVGYNNNNNNNNNNNVVKENKCTQPQYGDNGRDASGIAVNRESLYGGKDSRHVEQQHQFDNSVKSSYNNRDRYGTEQQLNRYRGGDSSHNNTFYKTSLASSSGKVPPKPDPLTALNRERYSKVDRPFSEDPFLADFDDRDLFSGGIAVIKRKKDATKSTDFHDPVRESFEAELERVQKMQELERQRIIGEQERALEQARREEDERLRKIHEEEELKRRVEEETREAAWRAEKERIEAIRMAEDQRIAREEEKKRIYMEEERRKQAAKQKLLELEAQIAKRQAEATAKGDVSVSNTIIDEPQDNNTWEDGERMVDKLTTSSSFDSSVSSRHYDMSSRPYPPMNYWRRDVFESGSGSSFPSPLLDHEDEHYNPNRAVSRKEYCAGPTHMLSSRAYSKPGVLQDPYMDEFGYQKEQRWNNLDNGVDKYSGDIGWGQVARSDRFFPHPETDEFYSSYGRSRNSMRQPRVLPPPAASFGGVSERAGPTNFVNNNEMHYPNTANEEQQEVVELQQEKNDITEGHKLDAKSMCDSQSSLSVSSPPNSPPHLSQDELDESGDSVIISEAEMNRDLRSGSEFVVSNNNSGVTGDSTSNVEDEEWTDGALQQQQEEYDEDDDGYREEDEVLRDVGDGKNLELSQKFDLEETDVLGFDEGVKVVIPSDDYEKDSETQESKHDGSIGIVEKIGPADEKTNLPSDNSSSCKIQETELPPLQGSFVTDSSTLPAQQTVSSSVKVTAANDLPVQLQFGLFSGPPLIPSPVPAIQIGSIQMPLHFHPPSQPPIFQFGQLQYTSPISQGILSITPQSVSFIQPNKQQVHLNQNQNQNQNQSGQDSSTQNLAKDKRPELPVVDSSTRGLSSTTTDDKKIQSEPLAERKRHHDVVPKNYLPLQRERGSESKFQQKQQSDSGERNFTRPIRDPPGQVFGGRGNKYAYAVKNTNTRPSFLPNNDIRANSDVFQRRPRRDVHVQRTEFRVRENHDRRQAAPLFDNNSGLNDRSGYNNTGKVMGVYRRSGSKRGTVSNVPTKQNIESEPVKDIANNATIESKNREANLRRNVSEEDVDAPLVRGVVRVYKQPGIEVPSDEDDFIEVRSKRQMLNDRREQREKEKEIKAKSLATKQPHRKLRGARQNAVVSRGPSKVSVPFSNGNNEMSTGFSAAVSQPMAPIGAPAVNVEEQAMKPPQTVSISNDGTEREAGVMFEGNQQVMSLTQTQLEEAMKPAQYDSHVSTVGVDPILPTSSILTKEKTFSSGASPIDSLLAGEKIQFGAVTSPTVLPPSSRAVSQGIGAPGSNRHVLKSDSSIFFEKEKPLCDDSEAEAEAAASAVAVAAICSDEIVGNGLGPVNVPDTKCFRSSDIAGITTGGVGDQPLANSSSESLSVSLPADLSIETPPISLWPPFPSPQGGSSSQILSHFPNAPPPPPHHYPFYEMNPLLHSGPILTFTPPEESQSQHQKSSSAQSSSSGPPISNWQQDSFYGPNHFGVSGPPHMVVYNHFAPVGQYGQMGLSFMGTTFIPSGNQSDWKHNNQTSSSGMMHVGDGDVNNNNHTINNIGNNSQRNLMAPIQHLPPPGGSTLLPMGSPLPMFNVSPFQTAPDMSVQSRWGHITPPPLHSVPVSRPQVEGSTRTSQIHHTQSVDQSLNASRFSEPRIQTTSDNVPSFSISQDTNITTPFSPELGLVDQLRSTAPSIVTSGSNPNVSIHAPSNSEPGKNEPNLVKNSKRQNMKPHFTNKNVSNSGGYNYQRGGGNQRNYSANEWSNRRMGFHGRNNQSSVGDRGFAPKMKQIYVAKTERQNEF